MMSERFFEGMRNLYERTLRMAMRFHYITFTVSILLIAATVYLGMQSHFGGTPTPPEKMLSILDRYAAIGLDISITEHDIDTDDEQLQADFTRDFLTTVFSHPAVVAVLTWGFWENSHWKPDAAYYRSDWSLRPAGQVWRDLVTKKWWTNEAAETGADGHVRTRGFLGDYEISVSCRGVTKQVKAVIPRTGAQVDIRL